MISYRRRGVDGLRTHYAVASFIFCSVEPPIGDTENLVKDVSIPPELRHHNTDGNVSFLVATVLLQVEDRDAFVIDRSFQNIGMAQRPHRIVVTGAPMSLHA
jgi:hypothetical protein